MTLSFAEELPMLSLAAEARYGDPVCAAALRRRLNELLARHSGRAMDAAEDREALAEAIAQELES